MRRHIYYTLQSLLHKQGSNAIKIVSLALGLLMSVFLFARIAFELSFDNFYHDSDNLYIVKTGKIRNFYLITGNLIIFTLPISYVVLHYGCSPESVFIVTISFSFLAMMCRIYFLHKLIKIPFLEYIIELIKLFIATVVICIVVTLYIYVTPDSAMRFFIVIILSSVLHLIMYYYFVISGNDRKALNGYEYFKEMWDRAVAGESDFYPLFIGWNELKEYSMPYTGFNLTQEEWKNQFGIPVEEHQKSMQVNIFEGYAVFDIQEKKKVTDKSTEKAKENLESNKKN